MEHREAMLCMRTEHDSHLTPTHISIAVLVEYTPCELLAQLVVPVL
jgi:hypothetical protein